jgi:uncharacterized protein (TIGR02453 family)
MTSPFTVKTLKFLRALQRHNDREWFREHKARYETDVRQPMIALIEQLAIDFTRVAPEFIAEPKVSLHRIYRDTRFSADKSPLKTHVSARFPMRGMAKGEGGGLYVEVAPSGVWMGGGLYMPSAAQLQSIRAQIASTHPRLHRLVTAPAFRTTVGSLEGERLSRMPRGYRSDHPAAPYLQFKQFLAGREFDAKFATTRAFYRELLATFRAVAPVVRFLNAGLATTPAPDLPAAAVSPPDRTQTGSHPPVRVPMW